MTSLRLLDRIVLLSAIVSCGPVPPDVIRLELSEVGAVRLPRTFTPRGADISANGALLYWNDTAAFVARDSAYEGERLCRHDFRHVLSGAFLGTDSIVEMIDAAGPSLIRVVRSGDCSVQLLGSSGSEVVNGVHSHEGWSLTLRTGPVTANVVSVSFGGETRKRYEILHHPKGPFDLGAAFVTSASQGTLHASMTWPFKWAVVDSTGGVVLTSQAFSQTGNSTTDTTFVDWVGLAVVALDQGFLQTIADPRSDRRLLIRYDGDGHLASQVELAVVFGVLASLPQRRLLVALRRSDVKEIVLYRWDWRRTHDRKE